MNMNTKAYLIDNEGNEIPIDLDDTPTPREHYRGGDLDIKYHPDRIEANPLQNVTKKDPVIIPFRLGIFIVFAYGITLFCILFIWVG